MKKLSIIIASLAFFSSVSIASVYQAAQPTTSTSKTIKKPVVKKADKKDVKKVPHRTTNTKKPAATSTTQATKK